MASGDGTRIACKFACPQVKYLGHVVSPEGIAPDDDKISVVKDFLRPHNIKTVWSFLGLANYYRRFIKDFAKIVSPLNQLLRKNHNFVWTNACEEAFKALKDALISAPILAFPDFKEPFHLYTDASSEGIGVTLGQIQNNRKVAIAYAGRDFNAAEKNYSTTEREALAVIFGIKKFEPYLYGRKFILHTDHHSLKWLMTISDPSGKLARWSLLVQQYDFEIKHRPGVAHGNADALSCRPYTPPPLTISAYDVPGVQIERVRDFQRRDPDLADLIQYLESSKLPDKDSIARSLLLTIDDYFLSEDGLLFHLWTPKGRRRTTTHQQLVIPAAQKFVGCLILQRLTLRHIIPPVMVKLSVSITPLLKPFLCLLIRNRLIGTCIYLLFFLLIGFRLVCLPVIVHSISFMAGSHG